VGYDLAVWQAAAAAEAALLSQYSTKAVPLGCRLALLITSLQPVVLVLIKCASSSMSHQAHAEAYSLMSTASPQSLTCDRSKQQTQKKGERA